MTTFLPQLIAQSIENPAFDSLTDMSPTEFFGGLIPALIALGLVIGAVVFFFYFIMGAIHWITSGGDKMKMEQARSKITTALVGIIILLSFIGILGLIERFFGIGLGQIRVGPFQIEFSGRASTASGSSTSETIPSGGNSNCPCGGECAGYFATTNTIGPEVLGPGTCWECTPGGWVDTGTSTCSVLRCGYEGDWDCRNP